jgi:hypothetical protein
VNRLGVGLVEVLVALALVALQVPPAVATVAAAASLTARAAAILSSLDDPALIDRCHRP